MVDLVADGHEAQLADEPERASNSTDCLTIWLLTVLQALAKGEVGDLAVGLPQPAGYDELLQTGRGLTSDQTGDVVA